MIGIDSKQHQNILSTTMKTYTENTMKQLMIIEGKKENHIFYLKMEYQEKKFKGELVGFIKQKQHITNIDILMHYTQDQARIH
jgi:hypothetical protein